MEIRGQHYKLRTFEEITGADFRRIVNNTRRAAEEPEHLISLMRSTVAVLAPLAVNEMKRWNDGDVLIAAGEAMKHLGGIMGEFTDLVGQFNPAIDGIREHLTAVAGCSHG